jgi:beta-1,4-mannosyltransferase
VVFAVPRPSVLAADCQISTLPQRDSSPRLSPRRTTPGWCYKVAVPAAPSAPTRVLHFPDWRRGNPYQGLLAAALERQAVAVEFATYAGALMPLTRNVLGQRPQVLHLHWMAEIAGVNDASTIRSLMKQLLFRVDVTAVRQLLRGRLVWTVHNLSSHESRDSAADRSARRFLARHAAFLFAHGPAAQAEVVHSYGVAEDRVVLAYHGHFMGAYPNNSTRNESRRRWSIGDDRFVFLYFGSLRPYKGVEDLIAAFGRLSAPRKLLIVAGHAADPAYGEALRRQAVTSDILLLDRFIPREDVQFLFNACDAVVLPFREILTSSSLLLALSFGRIVVAPRLGCVPDYADPSFNMLYQPGAPDALARALESTLRMDVEACGRLNLASARRFDWDDTAARTAAVYRRLVAD